MEGVIGQNATRKGSGKKVCRINMQIIREIMNIGGDAPGASSAEQARKSQKNGNYPCIFPHAMIKCFGRMRQYAVRRTAASIYKEDNHDSV